ncbi:mineralocorticoid receptor-like isoform X2 [Paramormyrops kingsleyae]|uniref:mineralocorticoid receptor-like isoform X2 n=1 Tax=Paramormyrops kingsleyae TaxID=1676925 RepID=UPI000CD627E9|nr:mineralocorticoid receptor-like isoform X2 [Paramormyrops kingsleyae]
MSLLRCITDLAMETKRYQGFFEGADSANRWDRRSNAAEYCCAMQEENGTSGALLMDVVNISPAPSSLAAGYMENEEEKRDLSSLCLDQQHCAFPQSDSTSSSVKLEMDAKELSRTVADSMGLYMDVARELDYGFSQQGLQGGGVDGAGKLFSSNRQSPAGCQGSPKLKATDLLCSTSYPSASHPCSMLTVVDCSSDEALASTLGGSPQTFNSSISSPTNNSLVSSNASCTTSANSASALSSPVHQASSTPSLALINRQRISTSGSPASTINMGSPLGSPASLMRSPLSSPQSMRSSVSSPIGGSSNMQTSISSPKSIGTAAVSSPPISAGFSIAGSASGCPLIRTDIHSPGRTDQDFKGFDFPKVEPVDGEQYSVALDQLGMVKYIKNEPNTDSRAMCQRGNTINMASPPFPMQIKTELNRDAPVTPNYNGHQHSSGGFPASDTTYLSLRDNIDAYSLSGILGPPVPSLNSDYEAEVFSNDMLPKGIKQESKDDSYLPGNSDSQTSAVVGVNSGGHSFHYQIGAQGTMSFPGHDAGDQTSPLLNLISPVAALMESWKSRSIMAQDSLSSRGEIFLGQQCITDVSSPLRTSSSGTTAKVCLVCGDEASGCHYGVITCGSCKVFFKRAVEGQHNYLCAGRNDCIIDKIRRKNCPACRVRKCLQAGMNLGARKSKKLGKLKGGSDPPSQDPKEGLEPETELSGAALVPLSPGVTAHLSPSICSVLELIEPEVVYAGYDNTQPDTTDHLLSSLNQLAGKQMIRVVKWAKVLPGFRSLPIEDQITLIQYSWMCLSSFALSWRSYKHTNGQMLYFAPDLVFNEERMQQSAMYDLCVGMRQVSQEFVRLQLTHEEFLAMKVLLLLSTVPKDGLKNQAAFEEMRMNYIKELRRSIAKSTGPSGQTWPRFYQLTRLLDAMHDLVGNLLDFCFYTFRESQALKVEFPEMLVEIISDQIPKVESGLTHTLYFHKK